MGDTDSSAADARPVWDRRVRELLGRMTLAEKVGQISTITLPPLGAGFDVSGTEDTIAARPPGIVLVPAMPGHEMAARVAAFQDSLTGTRLGVPALPVAIGGTHMPGMPGPMGAAATWDVAAVERLAVDEAAELRAAGVFATLGSATTTGPANRVMWAVDPVLAAGVAVARVRGAQGRDAGRAGPIGPHRVALVIPMGVGRDGSWHERTLRTSLLAATEAAVRAGAAIVVPSTASNAGVPGHTDSWLLKQVLRQDWGFSGIVVSAAGAIQGLVTTHGVAAGVDQAIASVIEAGVDVINSGPDAVSRVVDLIETGAVPQWLVDDSAATVLQLKFRLGLLDRIAPGPRPTGVAPAPRLPAPRAPAPRSIAARSSVAAAVTSTAGDRAEVRSSAVATRAVAGSLVLLSDPTGALPLPATGVVYVVSSGAGGGPGGELGGGPATAPEGDGLVQALKEVLPGADVRTGTPRSVRDVGPSTVLLLATDPEEAAPLAGRMVASGRRCVVLLCSERLDRLDELATTTATILLCWQPLRHNVEVVAEVLAGRVEPEGRLPLGLPVAPNPRSVVYPLGHGSGYTTFQYSRLRIAPAVLLGRESVRVRCLVTNTGDRAGRDVVQVYLGRRTGTVVTPGLSLAAFTTVRLGAGQSLPVAVAIPPERLAVWDRSMRHVLQPGTVSVHVGRSAGDIHLTGALVVNSAGPVDRWA